MIYTRAYPIWRLFSRLHKAEKGNGKPVFRLACFLVALLFVSPGCLEQIDLEVPKDLESAIVIQGNLVKGTPSTVRIEINSLFTFTGSSRRFIDVLRVDLIDETDQLIEVPSADRGIYILQIPDNHPLFKVEIGKSYRVRVSTRDGRVYESAPDRLEKAPLAQKLIPEVFDKEVLDKEGQYTTGKYIRFLLDTPLKTTEGGKNLNLKWDAIRVYKATDLGLEAPEQTCYIPELADVTKLRLLDGKRISADRIESLTVHEERVSARFAEGFYLLVLQQAISDEAFQYWEQVNELIERTGSIFEPPAGKIRGNFTNIEDPEDEVFGLFYVTEQDTVRAYVSPEFAGNPAPFCPPSGPLYNQSGICQFTVCCNCTELPGSSPEKPEFWIE